ncbi:MAG: hypothetical protein DM484_17410 [Candidatus Methylumidiphilus alinenensis]|uniref:Uncharacterized protein n=1 Tax=Candidatus Methylumidiphilus alinenensis TaxID=2202197 RepID=A0A2W4QVH7_9GAMM|nr:MAG: hypothetical protein DM484_17410 [Candidatus Methylumidiphilus alinenensis]
MALGMVGAFIYHVYEECADEGGALFTIDALRSSAHSTALVNAKLPIIRCWMPGNDGAVARHGGKRRMPFYIKIMWMSER